MSEKKRKTISMDMANHEWLQQQYNASGKVNELITQARKYDGQAAINIDLQIRKKQTEIENTKRELAVLEEELAQLEERREGMDE